MNAAVPNVAWLIETVDVGITIYFCNDGDWCSNANHAHKFPTADQASMKLASMRMPENFRVVQHMWCDVEIPPTLVCPACGADRAKEGCKNPIDCKMIGTAQETAGGQ